MTATRKATPAFLTTPSLSLSSASSTLPPASSSCFSLSPISVSVSAARRRRSATLHQYRHEAPRRYYTAMSATNEEGSTTPTPSDSTAEQPPTPAPVEPTAEDEAGQTSAEEILKTLREDSAADMAAQEPIDGRSQRSMLGVYRDVDGKSNVWAVEPQEETDTRPQLSKTVIILVAAGFILAALLILPILPFTNPDQL